MGELLLERTHRFRLAMDQPNAACRVGCITHQNIEVVLIRVTREAFDLRDLNPLIPYATIKPHAR
jgi:hypothetical protein